MFDCKSEFIGSVIGQSVELRAFCAIVCRKLVVGLSAAVAISCLALQASGQNIVLFVADDHGADAGCYGNSVIQTPNMDALASEGVVFDRAFATTASCSASRSVILTGLHNHLNGQFGHVHDFHKFSTFVNVVSLPVYLNAAGYRTARCGKFHVAPESVYQFGEVLAGKGRNTVAQAQACRKFLESQDQRPFFLYFCTSDPHRSGQIIQSDPAKPNAFGNRPKLRDVEPTTYSPDEVIVPGFLPDTPTCRAELAQYYESVSRVDQGLGRLMQLVKDSGHWDDTLFIYASDHGIAMPGAKTTLYEPGMRSPCIVRLPNSSIHGQRSDAMVSWVDLTPTILDYAGVYRPASENEVDAQVQAAITKVVASRTGQTHRNINRRRFHGRSFLPAAQGKSDDVDAVFASHTFHEIQMYYPMRVVREQRYKLIWNIAHQLPYPFASDLWAAPTWQRQYEQGMDTLYGERTVGQYIQRPEFELYDLEVDPHESNNLAEVPEHRETLDRLKTRLKQFQKETSDPWIMKWDYE